MNTMSGQGRPPIEAERKAAEHEYITTSFNYPEAPVGSRDWTIYWAGWLARSTHALASSVAKPETQEPEPPVCPECDGSGEIMVMSDGGPDAYEVSVCCDHCNGEQTLAAAYEGVVKLLAAERKKYHEAAAILFLGRGDRKAADRLREIAEYVMKLGFSPEWARDRLLALADMASVASPSTGAAEGAKPAVQQSAPQAEVLKGTGARAALIALAADVRSGGIRLDRNLLAQRIEEAARVLATPTSPTPAEAPAGQGEALHGFSREDLEAIADGLDSYESTVNVGNTTGEGDTLLESTTAAAARFIRTALATPLPAQVQPAEQVGEPNLLEACRALLSLIRREAPHLSGKVLGDAEAALATPAQQQPVSAEAIGDVLDAFEREHHQYHLDHTEIQEWISKVRAALTPPQAPGGAA